MTTSIKPVPSDSISSEDFVTPFIKSTESVFEAMLGVETTFGPLEEVQQGHQMFAVTSVIGLTGEHLTGSISISLGKDVAKQVLERLTGIEAEEVDDDVRDAIGEMANMIAGQGKRDLTDFVLQLGLPQVIVGEDYTVYSPRWARHYFVAVKTDMGPCTLDVGFDFTGK